MKEENRILVVDDDEIVRSTISLQLEFLGHSFESATNGVEALAKIKASHFDILITDINMPEMNGIELVKEVNQKFPKIISIVMSSPDDIAKAIDILSGYKAYAYLIKPVNRELLKKAIDEAFDYIFVNQKVIQFVDEEKEFYKSVQDVFDWKREITDRKIEDITKDLIHQINIGLIAGGGFGALVGSLNLMFAKSKPNSEATGFVIPNAVYNLIKENYEQTNKLITGLSYAQTLIMEKEACKNFVFPEVLFETIQKCIRELEPMLKIKDQSIKMSSLPNLGRNAKLIFDYAKMYFTISELLINAMKYSKHKDVIYILFFFRGDALEIKFLNPAYNNADGSIGISGKYENLVLEPFFRMSDSVDDSYTVETVKFGLGLPIVKKIMDLHGGNVAIYNVNNNMKMESQKDICVSLRMPVVLEEWRL